MNTEYLITFESEKKLCNTSNNFKKLLSIHNEIVIDGNNFKFKNKKFKYELSSGKLSDGSIYYDLCVELDDINNEDEFNKLLREIRSICTQISGRQIVELKNAISEYYCQKGYTIVYKIETLMRKLIYKFMAISIGYKWKDESTPREVIESIRDKKENINFLYEIDFIKLSDFLFKNISKTDHSQLVKLIKDASSISEDFIQELKSKLPYSNWERFFAQRLNCESSLLKTKWEQLYDLRCMIAHNKNFTKEHYIELEELSNEVCQILESAFKSINEIKVEDEDRDEIAENITFFRGDNTSNFIKLYNLSAIYIKEICELCSSEDDTYKSSHVNKKNYLMQIRYLCNNKNIFTKELLLELEELNKFRNVLIHQFGINEISEKDIIEKVTRLDELVKILYKIYIEKDKLESLKGIDKRNV